MTFDLPFPPSVNTYWRSIGRGRVILSEKGREYRKACLLWLSRQGVPRIDGRLAVTLSVFPPDARRRDLDNLPKGLLDALTHAQVIVDDELIDDLRITRGPKQKGGLVQVTILNANHTTPESAR